MREFQQREEINYDDWLKKEQEFHEEQEKIRSKLRIEQERYQPVDYFIEAVLVYKGKKTIPNDVQYMKNPELIIKKLTTGQLQRCLEEAELQKSEEGTSLKKTTASSKPSGSTSST